MNIKSINTKRFTFLRRVAFFALVLFALSAFGGAATTFAQGKSKPVKKKLAEPRTVKDFYLRLPAKYFPYVEDIKNRAGLIGTNSIAQGYLNFDNNGPLQPVNGQILLLKRMSGVPLLVISYTDNILDAYTESLRFVEYENNRWTEVNAAPPLDRQQIAEIYQRKTGQIADDKTLVIYEISLTDKSIRVKMVKFGEYTEIYKLEWDGNIFDFAAPNE